VSKPDGVAGVRDRFADVGRERREVGRVARAAVRAQLLGALGPGRREGDEHVAHAVRHCAVPCLS